MAGMNVGYIRVSSDDQNPDRQLNDTTLTIDKKFIDKASGSTTDRPQFQAMMVFLREGDCLYVHSMDRLARNLKDLLSIVDSLTNRGVTIHFYKEGMIFNEKKNPASIFMLQTMGACAQFERELIRERQREGIELYKKKGGKLGREQVLSTKQIEEMKKMREQGAFVSDLVKHFNLSKSSVYRYLEGVKPKRVFVHELIEVVT